MNLTFISVLAMIFSAFLSSSTYSQIRGEQTDKSYPFGTEPGLGTMSSVFFIPPSEGKNEKLLFSKTFHQRNDVYTLEKKAKLNAYLWRGHSKKLIIIIPGIGSGSDTGSTRTAAKLYQSLGFNVLTISSPFEALSALTLLPNATPGYFPKDSLYVYEYLKEIKKRVELQVGSMEEFYLSSFSLGGQYAIEILKLDDQHRDFNFKNVIIMNPPADIEYAINKYDHYFQRASSTFSADGKISLLDNVTFKVFNLIDDLQNFNKKGVEELVKFLKKKNTLSKRDVDVVLSYTFTETLKNVLYVTSLVHEDAGIFFRSRLTRYRREPRYQEIRGFNFKKYFQTFIQPNESGDVFEELSFTRNPQKYLSDPRVLFVLGLNDSISRRSDLETMSQILGNRSLVFEGGGHCGLYWFPGFKQDLKDFLSFHKIPVK